MKNKVNNKYTMCFEWPFVYTKPYIYYKRRCGLL